MCHSDAPTDVEHRRAASRLEAKPRSKSPAQSTTEEVFESHCGLINVCERAVAPNETCTCTWLRNGAWRLGRESQGRAADAPRAVCAVGLGCPQRGRRRDCTAHRPWFSPPRAMVIGLTAPAFLPAAAEFAAATCACVLCAGMGGAWEGARAVRKRRSSTSSTSLGEAATEAAGAAEKAAKSGCEQKKILCPKLDDTAFAPPVGAGGAGLKTPS